MKLGRTYLWTLRDWFIRYINARKYSGFKVYSPNSLKYLAVTIFVVKLDQTQQKVEKILEVHNKS